ncbi:MAG: hypothetical protein Tsb0032_02850 [Kiloniellaceae bacterium]
MSGDALEARRLEETAQPVAPSIAAIVDAARARHGTAVAAVLFYGSCLRLGEDESRIVDLYVLVDSYRSVYGGGPRALLNWVLPPNVYYLEAPFEDRKVRAKVALISLDDFSKGASGGWFHPYLWARFAQPCRLPFCRDVALRGRLAEVLAASLRKVAGEGLALVGDRFSSRDLWVSVFRQTYRTELRAEPPERAEEIYRANAAHYDAMAEAVLPSLGARWEGEGWVAPAPPGPGLKWPLRRVQGKLLSVARLVKAAFTFQDGAQYLLWKIERHSGVSITLTPWQRRHPILASSVLFWKLYRKGAFR